MQGPNSSFPDLWLALSQDRGFCWVACKPLEHAQHEHILAMQVPAQREKILQE